MQRTSASPSSSTASSLIRLRQAVSEISAHIGGYSISPAELYHVCAVNRVGISVKQGQPHKVWGTRAIRRDDLDRLLAIPADVLLGQCAEGVTFAREDAR